MHSSKVVLLFTAFSATVTIFSIEVTSFTVSINNPGKISSSTRHSSSSPLKRPATIIGWDDESSSYISTFDEPSNDVLGGYGSSSDSFMSIADTISADMTASLARMAAAFSPPGHSINLEDITQIQVVQVSNSHIELSAIVCDESQCVTILVPVPFQNECSVFCESMETCILNNINELDIKAQQVLNQQSLGSYEEEKELLKALHNSSNLHYPSWWVSPRSYDMSQESQHITNTLNQDRFQSQIQALAKKGLDLTQDGYMFDIKRVAVCTIGPAGFYFRAIAVQKNDISSSSSKSTILERESPCTILEIPLPFSSHQASSITDGSSLRSAVLGVVSSI